jgi:alkylation response protein AidB-like acyl-CoA dehydrogenase
VQVPAAAPGVRINDDWDALGMRSSGSNSVTFDGVELPEAALRGGFPAGEPVPFLVRNLPSGLFHASASLGIAEASFARAAAKPERIGDDARARMLVAEAAIELATSRAVIARAASLIDEHYEANPETDGSDEAIVELFAEGQAAKTYVNEAATRIVDRALALSGGAGYLNGSPLARAYRDVRAGAFMHPLGANRAYDFLGDVALHRPVRLH